MNIKTGLRRIGAMCVVAAMLALSGVGPAMAQGDPTLSQVYAAAQAGNLAEAQNMMQKVLADHPGSGKAHYVQAELFARQGDFGHAREALARAENLAPGLPFAKPQAVQALRAELANRPLAVGPGGNVVRVAPAYQSAPEANWKLPLLLAVGAIFIGYLVFRRRAPVAPMGYAPAPGYGGPGSLSGPQTYGNGAAYPGYGPAPQPGYGPPAGGGLGGQIMGGVATGLAVGAGVMAAEAIGRNLMGGHEGGYGRTGGFGNDYPVDNNYQNVNPNPDMGGQDFGINDTSSWDDGGGLGGGGGGGDW